MAFFALSVVINLQSLPPVSNSKYENNFNMLTLQGQLDCWDFKSEILQVHLVKVFAEKEMVARGMV